MANKPDVGEMLLHDYILPPLTSGRYRLDVATQVEVDGAAKSLAGQQAYFDIDGPRFTLAPNEVAGVFPPRNGHGPFDEALPHIALGRRTLPWERSFAAARVSVDGTPLNMNGTPIPWIALLMFEDGECNVEMKQKIGDKLPADVVSRLNVPADLLVDTVTAERGLVRGMMPAYDELALLAHVRQVNVNDRELAAGDSDGFFAVLMSNRIPQRGRKYRCCLVSIEERTDIVPAQAPSWEQNGPLAEAAPLEVALLYENSDELFLPPGTRTEESGAAAKVGGVSGFMRAPVVPKTGSLALGKVARVNSPHRILFFDSLVLLTTWTFDCEGSASFRALMQSIDVGMIGKPHNGGPRLTDTAHQRVDLVDRAGAPETVFYRGPLVPTPLARDTNGPYHNADQARRIAPEVGAEDVSYACAFEVGRLLAAADARLAQELMRWRRGAYVRSLRLDTLKFVKDWMHIREALDPFWPLGPLFVADIMVRVARGCGPLADPFDLDKLSGVPGFDPELLRQTFSLGSIAEARELLGLGDALLGSTVSPAELAPGRIETLDDVLRDIGGLTRLQEVRDRVLDNARTQLRDFGRTR